QIIREEPQDLPTDSPGNSCSSGGARGLGITGTDREVGKGDIQMHGSYPARKVLTVLKRLGFERLSKGRGGHSVLKTKDGKRICPPLRRKEMPYAHLCILAFLLETQGIVRSRQAFITAVKSEAT